MSDTQTSGPAAYWRSHADSRLANCYVIACQHISAELCDRLARLGMPALALELMRQRGDIT